ncbi:MAG: hypothetical protein RLZZ04_1298 [Cyanobacteriota bacterium]|jgi:hypothetical protein
MTIKISDLEFRESLLNELSENKTSRICGGAGATDAALASMEESAASQMATSERMSQLQAETSAAQAKASLDAAVSRNAAQMAKSIKS